MTAPADRSGDTLAAVLQATGTVRGDLGVEDGASHSGHEADDLFLGCGGGDFARLSGLSGFHNDGDGRSLARWDYDRDGRVDLALASANRPLLQVFHNELGEAAGGFLAVRLHGGATPDGPPGTSNRDAVGAVVEARLGDRVVVRELRRGEGFAAQSSATVLLGIGDAERVDELTVRWPSGRTRRLRRLPSGAQIDVWEVRSQAPRPSGWTLGDYEPAQVTVVTEPAGEPFPWADQREGDAPLQLFTSMATWCGSCRGEVPWFAETRGRFGADALGLVALPVEVSDGPAELAEWVDELAPAYALRAGLPVHERERLRAWLTDAVGREAVPSSVLVDRAGRVLWVGPGLPSRSQLWRATPRP